MNLVSSNGFKPSSSPLSEKQQTDVPLSEGVNKNVTTATNNIFIHTSTNSDTQKKPIIAATPALESNHNHSEGLRFYIDKAFKQSLVTIKPVNVAQGPIQVIAIHKTKTATGCSNVGSSSFHSEGKTQASSANRFQHINTFDTISMDTIQKDTKDEAQNNRTNRETETDIGKRYLRKGTGVKYTAHTEDKIIIKTDAERAFDLAETQKSVYKLLFNRYFGNFAPLVIVIVKLHVSAADETLIFGFSKERIRFAFEFDDSFFS